MSPVEPTPSIPTTIDSMVEFGTGVGVGVDVGSGVGVLVGVGLGVAVGFGVGEGKRVGVGVAVGLGVGVAVGFGVGVLVGFGAIPKFIVEFGPKVTDFGLAVVPLNPDGTESVTL